MNPSCLDLFLADKQPNTQYDYRIICQSFLRFLSNEERLSCTMEEAKLYCDRLLSQVEQGELSFATMVKKIRVLSSFYTFLERLSKDGECEPCVNYFLHLIPAHDDNAVKNRNLIPLDTLRTLLTLLEEKDAFLYAVVLLCFKCMLTSSELLLVQKKDFFYSTEEQALTLRIPASLSKENRELAVPPDVEAALAWFLSPNVPANTRLLSENQEPMKYRTVLRRLNRLSGKAGLPRVSFNQIRNAGLGLCKMEDKETLAKATGNRSLYHVRRLCHVAAYYDAPNYVTLEETHE